MSDVCFHPVNIKVVDNPKIQCKVSVGDSCNVRLIDTTIIAGSGDKYDGEYAFTPSSAVQVIDTKDKMLTESIVINPIPQNYGLIEWDGSTLTIS